MKDRRYRKTEEAIFAAMQRLTEHKPISQVTVSELARQADITRKAFYDHYPTVVDAYQAMLAEIVREVAAKTEQDWQTCAQASIECTPDEEMQTRLMLFLGNVRELVEGQADHSRRRNRYVSQEEEMAYLSNPFAECIREGVLGDPARFDGEEQLVAEFVLAGMLWMYRKWMAGGSTLPLVETQVRACRLIMGGLGAL